MKPIVFVLTMFALSGCLSTPQQVQAPSASLLDQETLALSCSDLSTRNANLETRMRELEAQNKRAQRQQALTGAFVNAGLTALVGAGASNGVSGLRNATVAANAIDGVRNAENARTELAQVQDGLALAHRSAELKRAMIEKGC